MVSRVRKVVLVSGIRLVSTFRYFSRKLTLYLQRVTYTTIYMIDLRTVR